jgi:hypothetical protein
VLQVLERGATASRTNPWLAALPHDLGKLLLLAGERPGSGLLQHADRKLRARHRARCLRDSVEPRRVRFLRLEDSCLSRWPGWFDITAFASRTAKRSANAPEPIPAYLKPSQRYDQGSKTPQRRPARPLAAYRDRLGTALPQSLVF